MTDIKQEEITKNMKLKDFMDLLKKKSIGHYSSVSDLDGHIVVRPWNDTFDGHSVGSMRLEFKGDKPESQLIDCTYEMKDEIGIIRKYYVPSLRRPWYKGGVIIHV